jgi:ssDNA-binding Zn-finger/Zn-ribbon topoisomerase 1
VLRLPPLHLQRRAFRGSVSTRLPYLSKKPHGGVIGKFGGYARCLDPSCKGRVDLAKPVDDIVCPQCGSGMKNRGTFLSCEKYPTCKGSVDKKALKAGKHCPRCNKLLSERKGLHGTFWGCTGYPLCRFIEKAPQPMLARRYGPEGWKNPHPHQGHGSPHLEEALTMLALLAHLVVAQAWPHVARRTTLSLPWPLRTCRRSSSFPSSWSRR